MTSSADRIQSLMASTDRETWAVAALVLALTGQGSDQLRSTARGLLDELGIDLDGDLGSLDLPGTAAQAAAPVFQVAAVLRGEGALWASQSDEALQAQGRASAQAAQAFGQFLLPMLGGLSEALDRPGARMLDVGTGVAALAVAFAEQWPNLTVVGLDVLPRVLALAAQTVAASAVGDRVLLREQDVASLTEVDTYHLGWLPAPFLPEPALRTGTNRVAQALVPGGWLMVGHGKLTGDRVDAATSRFKTVAYGGTALDDGQAQQLLVDAGLEDVSTLPTPPGAPAITVGRRP